MRQVLSLSLSEQLTKEIKENSKKRGFSSVSGYVKYLFELDKDLISEKDLIESAKAARREYQQGKAVRARSIADLL